MKIIATVGNWVMVESKNSFIFHQVLRHESKKFKKKDNPQLGIAAVAKWGYYRLRKPIEINTIDEIDEKTLKEARKLIMKRS